MTIRLGVILPPTNVTCEIEFPMFLPRGIVPHFNRLSRPDTEITKSSLLAMEATVERAAADLRELRPKAILYACTAATFLGGGGHDREIGDRVEAATGIPGITTSSAIIDAFETMGIKSVFMVSPYLGEVRAGAIDFLAYHGIKTIGDFTFGHTNSLQNWTRTSGEIADVIRAHMDQLSNADAVFSSCTNLRSIDQIVSLEDDLQIPVISSNSATIWRGLKAIDDGLTEARLGELGRRRLRCH
ncbi:maleate cis-trans isomerase [Sinorhizobium medicae]|nr:maleate cis-trans isomerase [Sinorhizobium medicae]